MQINQTIAQQRTENLVGFIHSFISGDINVIIFGEHSKLHMGRFIPNRLKIFDTSAILFTFVYLI